LAVEGVASDKEFAEQRENSAWARLQNVVSRFMKKHEKKG